MSTEALPTLKLPAEPVHIGIKKYDPQRFYHWPIIGKLYRRRVEMCLGQLRGGERILEVGYGSGLTFFNLKEMYREIHGVDLTADADAVTASWRKQGVETFLKTGNVLALPYPDNHFDSVLSISILEHLKPHEQRPAFAEMSRVLRPGGQMIYGVPVERPFMVFMFTLLGYNIREHHFSTEKVVADAAREVMSEVRVTPMRSLAGEVYQVGHFTKRS